MTEEVIGIRLRTDGVLETSTGIDLAGKNMEKLGQKAGGAAPQVDRLGKSSKETAAAFRLLPAQITDVVTSLASGQPAWLVAIQQGGQIKDSFGGIVPAARALVGAAGPVGLSLGAVAAAAVAVTVAYQQGRGESEAYARSLIMTGNAAGTSAGQLADNARVVAEQVGTQGKAADALTALAATGAVGANNLVEAATVAVQMERLLGQSVQDTAKNFAALGREPLAASLRLNQGTNYLTASVHEQIRALMAQGKTTEAAALAQSTYANAMKQRTDEVAKNLGILERMWVGLKDGAKAGWDAMLDVGRPSTTRQQLDIAIERLEALGPRLGPKARAEAEQRVQFLKEQMKLEGQSTLAQGAAVAANQKDLENQSSEHQAALAALERAGADRRLSELNLGLSMGRAAYEAAFQRNELTAADYQRAMLSIDTAAIDAQLANVNKMIAIEAARRPMDKNDAIQQRAAVVQLEARRNDILQRRTELLAQEARGERDVAPKPTGTDPRDLLRSFKSTDEANVDAYVKDRRAGAEEAAHQLVETNRQLGIDLIKDDRTRGEVQIAREEDELRRRLDLYYLNAEDRKKVDEDLAKWRVLRERQLTESLKPEWQLMLEAWSNTTKQMKDDWDGMMTGALRSGEDAFRQWARTGKLNIHDVFATLAAEAAASLFRKGAGGLFSLFSGGLSIDAGGYGLTTGGTSLVELGLGAGRAGGGPVYSGNAYPVGENGPELLLMGKGGGYVVPNHMLRGGGSTSPAASSSSASSSQGGRPSIVYAPVNHFNIDALADKAQIVAIASRVSQASLADFVDKMDRGEI